ncbi:MAG: phosphodiester glycosidase family protein [Polyangiaceae bacterium]|nr:phosphodiester glycosidase family protein [Polyangiaceae bacterium]
MRLLPLLALVAGGCAASPPPQREALPPPAPKPPVASEKVDAAPTAAAPEPPPPAPPALTMKAFAPPFERSAKAGDGQWQPVSEVPTDPPLMLETTVHPHPFKKDVYAVVVAVDLRRVELALVAGTHEPESKAVPREERAGLVPEDRQADLLAVFNGGFKARHGGYGMMVDQQVYVPAKDDACTIALYQDGSVRIRTFDQLAQADIRAYRQTPPCMVVDGELNEMLSGWSARKWGMSIEGKDDIRRTALGVDESGQVLLFGIGEWIRPKELALAMQLAGAKNVAELDINWSYTRFLFFGHPEPNAPLQVTATLIPKLEHSKRGYVHKASYRDFFYLAKKPSQAKVSPSKPHK